MEFLKSLVSTFLEPVAANAATVESPAATWVQPSFPEKKSILGHIFRNSEGHLPEDVSKNRAYILQAVASPSSWVGRTRFDQDVYLKLMPDGTQAWAYVQDGVIVNGGRNLVPKSWITDSTKYIGGRFVPLMPYQLRQPSETDFKVKIRFQKLIETYRDYGIAKDRLAIDRVKGVSQEYGVMLNLFEGVSASFQKEHLFLLPAPEGLFLEKEEIQQILRELAMGIFVHGQVPWFSLASKKNESLVPVIHPIYQNTFVGHVLSLLDYYMKSFDGMFYTPEFIAEWQKHPNLDEKFLKENSINFQEYCKKHGKQVHSFLEILLATKKEMNPSCSLVDFSRTVSLQIIAKQPTTIKKGENLLQLDGDFAIEFSIKPIPETDKELDSYLIYEEASRRHCEQIREILPQLPFCKKYFQALAIINFFSSYYVSLRKSHKVPILTEKPLSKEKCPTILPPIPITTDQRGWMCLEVASLLSSMRQKEKEVVFAAIQGDFELVESDSAVKIVANQISVSLDPTFLLTVAKDFLKGYRRLYEAFNYSMEEGIIGYKVKARGKPNTLQVQTDLIRKFEQYIELTNEDMAEIHRKVTRYRRQSLPVDVLLDELLQKEAFKKEMLLSVEMYQSWFRDPVFAASHKRLFVIDVVNQQVSFQNEQPKGQAILTGGCALRLVNKKVVEAQELLRLYSENRLRMQSEPAEKLVKVSEGYLFKLGFEDLSLVDEGEKASAIGLFAPTPKHPLTECEIKVFQAVANSDKDTFQRIALENFDIKDARGVALIHYAASKTNAYFLQTLIKQRAKLSVTDDQKFTAVHYAAAEGNLTALEVLITTRPDLINATGENGETALYLAAENGHVACIKFLLRHNAVPNTVTTQGFTPLLVAVYQGFEEVTLELLKLEATDIQVTLPDRSNIMHLAVEKRMERVCTQVARYLNPRLYRNGGYTALHIAAETGWLFGVQIILKEHPKYDINMKTDSEKTPLQLALDRGHKDLIRFLQQLGGQGIATTIVQPNSSQEPIVSVLENSSLHDACASGNLDAVHRLLKNGSDPYLEDARGFSSFDIAICSGQVEIVRKLAIEYEIPWDRKPYVQIAAEKGDITMLAWLTIWSAPLNLPNEHGKTGLQCAAQKGNKQIVSFLLCMGADPALQKQEATSECKELVELYKKISATTKDQKEIATRLNDRNALAILN